MSQYLRFIILSGPRTGSHMLAQALNSSSRVTCFREVFNGRLDFVDFSIDGYDNFGSRDIARRKEDPVGFLHERIFCRHPDEVRAVGFKFLYGQHWDFPGILDELVGDKELRVLHLRRRNALRMLVSVKLAERTGVWLEEGTSKVRRSNLLKAIRHPLKAGSRLQRLLRRPQPAATSSAGRVTISPDECRTFIIQSNMKVDHYDELFREHPKLALFYEDVLDRREDVFDEAQSFLDVEPQPLTVTLRQQNPEPLRELIENYDELYAAFKDTPVAAFFD